MKPCVSTGNCSVFPSPVILILPATSFPQAEAAGYPLAPIQADDQSGIALILLVIIVLALAGGLLWHWRIYQRHRAAQAEADQLRNLMARVPGIIYQFRFFPDGHFSFPYVSEVIRSIYNVSPGEIRQDATTVFDRLHPDDLNRVMESILASFASGEPWREQFRIIASEQREHWLEGQAAPERLADGSVLWHGLITDISDHREIELALQQSESRYQALFTQTHDAVFLFDLEGRLLEVNQRAADLLGYTVEEIKSLAVSNLSAELDKSEETRQRLLAGEYVPTYERVFRRKGGDEIAVEISVELVRDQAGRPLHIQSVARDITERKQAEAALRQSEEQYRTLVENISIGVYRTTAGPKGRILMANPAFMAAFGIKSEEELAQISVADLYQDPARRAAFSKQLLATGRVERIELPLKRRDGTPLWGAVTAQVAYDDEGRPAWFDCTMEDITERKQAEEALRQSEEALRLFFSQSLDGFFFMTMDEPLEWNESGDKEKALDYAFAYQRMTRVNQAMLEQYGASEEEFLGLTLNDLFKHDLAHGRDIVRQTFDSGRWRGVTNERRLDGAPIWIEGEYICLYDDKNRIIGQFGAQTDITERKRNEEALRQSHEELKAALASLQETQERLIQQERLAAVGQMAAGIAHDFNNIMAVILLYAQLASRSKKLPERTQEALATIEQQAKSAALLVEQLLDFSRRSMMERTPLDWLALLEEQVNLLRSALPEDIVLTVTAAQPGPYMVNADATRLQQMTLNLALNARDAMPDGGQFSLELDKISLDQSQGELAAGEWVRLRARDTGQGIPPEDQPYIFEPFFTTKGPGGGSGLGLSQAQGIVAQHDGHIEFTASPDQGTTFTVYLPALPQPEQPPSARKVTTVAAGQQETILLVEDDRMVREALAAVLEQLNYRVMAAGSGRQALARLKQQADQIDLILSDMVMPDMGGAALFHQLQERGWQIPMLVLTGHYVNHELEKLMAQGLSGWLTKPVNLNRLAALIEETLKKKDL